MKKFAFKAILATIVGLSLNVWVEVTSMALFDIDVEVVKQLRPLTLGMSLVVVSILVFTINWGNNGKS